MGEYTVREVTRETAALVPPLLYRGFGYTYSDTLLYTADGVAAAVEGGRTTLFLATDGEGEGRALLALRFPFPSRSLGELGALLVDPTLPGPAGGHVLRLLADALQARSRVLAREEGLRALVSTEVTVHRLTQRLVEQFGFVQVGILLGWVPAWAERLRCPPEERGREPSHAAQPAGPRGHRRSETVSVRAFSRLVDPYEVSVPRVFEAPLRRLYHEMKLPVSFTPPRPARGRSEVQVELDVGRGLARVELVHAGADAAEVLLERLAHFRTGMVDVVHVAVPLSGAGVDRAVEALLAAGSRYAAVLPFYRGHDVLLLQYLNDVRVELSENLLLTPAARRLYREVVGPVGGVPAEAP
jgi:hypothetical protein